MRSGAAFGRALGKIIMTAAWCAAGPAFASPWARDAGEVLIISQTKYFRADLTSEDPRGARFESIDNDTHIEVGVTSNLTIGGKAIYSSSWLTNTVGVYTDNGFSEIEGYVQYQVERSFRHAASVKLSAGKPAAFQASARDLVDDGADVEIAGLYGRNIVFAPVKIFTAAEIGYRRRFGDSADVMRVYATIGAQPGRHWMLLLEGFSTVSLRNEKNGGADYDIVKIQPSVVYKFNRRWAVQAGMTEEVLGRNLAEGRTLFIGLWSAF